MTSKFEPRFYGLAFHEKGRLMRPLEAKTGLGLRLSLRQSNTLHGLGRQSTWVLCRDQSKFALSLDRGI